MSAAPPLVYFSNASENTHRFVGKLGVPAQRIPLRTDDAAGWRADGPYLLLTPTYGGDHLKFSVPRQVAAVLNTPVNRELLAGVIGTGNTNFGRTYCLAAKLISAKCGVPLLYRFELLGTADDVTVVAHGLETNQWPQPRN